MLDPSIHNSNTQSYFYKVYKVKDENMKKVDCASFPMVCGPMFLWSGPPGATIFFPWTKGGPQGIHFFTVIPPVILSLNIFVASGGPDH